MNILQGFEKFAFPLSGIALAPCPKDTMQAIGTKEGDKDGRPRGG